jgi:hypothetical protein
MNDNHDELNNAWSWSSYDCACDHDHILYVDVQY